MKIIFGLLLFLTMSVCGQTPPCNLNLTNLPKIKKLRLGMFIDEFRKFLFVKAPADKTSYNIIIRRPELENFRGFENIERAVFAFEDDRLIYFDFKYDKKLTGWKDAKDFTGHLPEGIKLPPESWDYKSDSEAVMKCENFSAGVDSIGNQIYFYKKGWNRIFILDSSPQ